MRSGRQMKFYSSIEHFKASKRLMVSVSRRVVLWNPCGSLRAWSWRLHLIYNYVFGSLSLPQSAPSLLGCDLCQQKTYCDRLSAPIFDSGCAIVCWFAEAGTFPRLPFTQIALFTAISVCSDTASFLPSVGISAVYFPDWLVSRHIVCLWIIVPVSPDGGPLSFCSLLHIDVDEIPLWR